MEISGSYEIYRYYNLTNERGRRFGRGDADKERGFLRLEAEMKIIINTF